MLPTSLIRSSPMPSRRRFGYGNAYSSPYYDYRYQGKYAKKGVYGSK